MRVPDLNNISFKKIWVLRNNMTPNSMNFAKEIKNEISPNKTIKNLDKKDIDIFIFTQQHSYTPEFEVAFANIKTPKKHYIVNGIETLKIQSGSQDAAKTIIDMAQIIDNGNYKVKKKNSIVLDILNKTFKPRRKNHNKNA